MTSVSNLYAAKLYSEHPIAVWPLDDDVSYISLITDQQRTFEAASPYSGWTITGGTANDDIARPDDPSPFDSDIYAGIVGTIPLVDGTEITAKSPNLFLFSECSEELETFSVSMYVYQSSAYPTSYEIGYEYYDDDTASFVEVVSSFTALGRRGWINLQDTFAIQEFDADYGKIIFRATVDEGGVSGDYNFIINGITVGQWSETTLSKSLGAQEETAPISSGLSNKVVPADQYGILSDNAFYVSENGKLLAINEGIPMVFGSENVTRLYPSSNETPSLIFPNKTMFTDTGRYKDFTLEFWLKIRPVTKESRRIVGPLDTNDGIYVTEGFITLVIDKKFVSHNISEWYRPMIVHMVMKDEFVSMFINGEQVGQITVDRNSVNLSASNWMGFYSYEDFNMMEIDCISIFPYAVPLQVAKKRFVWGQGTDPIELINDAFDGEEAAISFSNAKYTVNKVYPDMERWDAGYYNNLIATTNSISVPQYSLPEINLGGRGIDEWYDDNNTVNNAEYPVNSHPRFFTFRPNQSTRTNLVTNPSFEVSVTGWQNIGALATLSRITSDSFAGTACLQVVRASNSGVGVNQGIDATSISYIPVSSGSTYRLSTYVKAVSGLPSLFVSIAWHNSSGAYISENLGTIVSASTSWQRLNVSAIAPSTAATARILVRENVSAGEAAATWLVDAILLEQSTNLGAYFDGSYADPTAKAIETDWSGTANASTSTMTYWTTEGTNWTEQCYLNFPSLSFLSAPLSAIYGVFEVEKEVNSSRPLIHIVNTLTNKRFEINIDGYDVTYSFDGQELSNTGFTVANNHFSVGIHMPTLAKSFNFELSSFFGSPEFLQMYVGGNGTQTFEGKVYRVGFSDQINYSKISTAFQVNGIIDYEESFLLEGNYASYTLSPFFRYGTYFLDISVSAQWEEYFPLSSFASYIDLSGGEKAYDLDYLQFNMGYPSLISLVATTTDNPNWSYQDLFDSYNDPVQKSYEILDNEVLTGYVDYDDLAENIITEYQIETSGSSLNAYATFQLIAEGADEPLSSFTQTKNLTESYTIYAEEENTNAAPYNAYKTKFRIVDGTIIYPPKKISFENVAMVVHFEIEQDGIISNRLQIRNLEITSKVLNKNGFTEIGTKTGLPIYPYAKTGIYYSGKSKNPVMISKNSLPYLYLTEKGGVRVLEDDNDKEYGIIVPINQNKSSSYVLGAIQMFMKYDIDKPIAAPQTVFTISYPDTVLEGVLTADTTGKRFLLTLRNKQTKQEVSGISFYQNGIKTNLVYLSKYQWDSVGISFDSSINFSNYSGSLNLLSGCSFDSISFFKSNGLGESGVTIARVWGDVLYGDQEQDPLNVVDWQHWYNENGILTIPQKWKDVYVLEESVASSITLRQIYQTYMGTNTVVVDDNSGVSLVNDDFTMFADQTWLKIVDKPA